MWAELNPPYATIVADPPWPFRWSGGPGGRRRNASPRMYSLMTLEDIAALPVGALTADEAHLYLWVTPEMNRKGNGVRVAEA
jgi:N6-adenosine-specific RNA methylase IME4